MSIEINFDNVTSFSVPSIEKFQQWCELVLTSSHPLASLDIKIIDLEEMQTLNFQYRKKQKPTNVLSFVCDLPPEIKGTHLGDLAFCAAIIEQEAQTQNKSLEAHWAHLVIHGVLHLLGYDHQTDEQANLMENYEIKLLNQLGFDNPYKESMYE